jgi:phosphatidate cytidylyltransferase
MSFVSQSRILTVIVTIPLVSGWLWAAKTYEQFWAVIFLLGIITGLGSWEYAKLMERSGLQLMNPLFVALCVLVIILSGLVGAYVLLLLTLAAFVLITGHLFQEVGVKSSAVAILGLFYLSYLLQFFYRIYSVEEGFALVMLLLALVWAYDTGAYLVGSRWGRRKLFPEVSPNKSWEGVLAGWVLAFAVGLLSPLWIPWRVSFAEVVFHVLVLSLLIGTAAQLGDLFESKLKRAAGVKDSGVLFPGHGGMLDRIDSLLFALPVFYSYLHYILQWV